MTKSPRELAARALCRKAGHPENTMFDGDPMWVSFLNDADAVLEAINLPSIIRDAEDAAIEKAALIADPPLVHRKGSLGLWRIRRIEIAERIRDLKSKR